MAITHTFVNGVFEAFKDGVIQIHQPFKPTSSGDQPGWESEQEALDWFYSEGNHRFEEEEIASYQTSLGAK